MIDHQAARDRAAESAFPRTGTKKDAQVAFAKRMPALPALPGVIGVNGLRPDWQAEAACAGMGTTIFFGDRGDSRPVAQAKAICARCTVADKCLQWAIDTGSRIGVFGGLTPRGRQGMKHGTYKVVKCGTTSGHAKHIRNGEPPCVPCAEARREYQRRTMAAARARRGRVA